MSRRLLYEDEWLLAVDKPAGVSMATPRGGEEVAVRRLLGACGVPIPDPPPLLVHRLDVGTSGVVLLAKDAETHRRLSRLFQEGRVAKRYWAIIVGVPRPQSGAIDLGIGMDPKDRRKMRASAARGKRARTEYRVLKTLRNASLLELRPITGRTHQIRVHLAATGHPILGDDLYRGAPSFAGIPVRRPMLHARSVEFSHPETGERLEISAPRPEDLEDLLQHLSRARRCR